MRTPAPRRRTLDPKNDVVFKILFAAERNRDLLIALLTAVLAPPSAIESAEVLNPEVDRQDWDDKGTVLDIRVRFADGRQVDVEMQAAPHPALRERALYYWSRVFCSELDTGQAYSELMPVIGVFILDFDELPTSRLHSIFDLRERHEGYCLCSALELHFLELPKRHNPTSELEGRAVLNWCQFLSAQTDEELEALAMTDPNMERAKQALDDLSADPKVRELARDRETWHYFYDRGLELSRRAGKREGREEGRAEGREEGRAEGREEGRAEGLVGTVRTVCELLGIELTAAHEARLAKASTAELDELLDSLKRDRRWPG
jgi:predicted transposase/invertase (TIGR01784 family)